MTRPPEQTMIHLTRITGIMPMSGRAHQGYAGDPEMPMSGCTVARPLVRCSMQAGPLIHTLDTRLSRTVW
jgi:hypothetical protein